MYVFVPRLIFGQDFLWTQHLIGFFTLNFKILLYPLTTIKTILKIVIVYKPYANKLIMFANNVLILQTLCTL